MSGVIKKKKWKEKRKWSWWVIDK